MELPRYSCQILIRLQFSLQVFFFFFRKYSSNSIKIRAVWKSSCSVRSDGRTDRSDINDETKYSLSTIFAAVPKMYEQLRPRQLFGGQKSEPGNYRLLPTATLGCWGFCLVNHRALQGYTSKQRSIHDLSVGVHRQVWRTKNVKKTRRIMQKGWSSEPSATRRCRVWWLQ